MSSSESDLDRALRALPAEPPAGFEARLMERLAAAPRPRRFHSGVAALALCAALASAIALMVIVRSPQPPHASPLRRAAARAIAPVPPRLAFKAAAVARVAVVHRPLPRRRPRLRAAIRRFPAQFPTPTPPTPSELALLRFVRTAPPAVVAAFAAAPDLQPIKIAAIEIKPLPQVAATWRGPERSGPPLPSVEVGPQPRPTGAASRIRAAPPPQGEKEP